ncbi:MAG TPA: FAD-dependent oxidoreductase [Bryobacteraceae bacterium]|nr:FAD-dependent oxidoreductase [Bryobacteraceae bacterium]
MNTKPAIIAFSHLRWDFVYQRPQHLLSRLAKTHKVYFIEEPVFDEHRKEWEYSEPGPNVTVCRPKTPCTAPGFHDEQMRYLQPMLSQLIAEHGTSGYILWFYTPMAIRLADGLKPRAVIYDCMDELSGFLGAPPELTQREQELLDRADLVFTGGPSLYRAKKERHRAVHCFPSSVDAAHFAKAKDAEPPKDQASLSHPQLGFFGVLDERLDLKLLESLATSHPEWQIVMVGPVVKIDNKSLPQAPNLHYLGQRSYAELPAYVSGWDVCLLPFARNASTKFISPTKTLEYMAAEKMIVSTPITDVAEPYGDIVYLGATAEEFITACELALAAGADERQARTLRMKEVLKNTSWDRTVAAMEELIAETIGAHQVSRKESRQADTIVVGAGPTGLSAAFHAGADSILIEQNDRVGGWCRSIEADGFTFDYAGHIMFSADPYVHQLYQMLLGDNVHWQDREAWIYSKNVYTRYPFQGSLYGLPAQVIRECIVGAVEARYGSLKPAKAPVASNGHAPGNGANGTNGNGANGTNGNGANATNGNGSVCHTLKDCCGDGVLEASAPLVQKSETGLRAEKPRNFEEFIYQVWGAGIAKHFAIPYNRKLWSVPLNEMETSWLGGRVPLPDLEEMIEGALSPSPKPMGPNARFGYPLRGGFQALMDAWTPYLKCELRLGSRVQQVTPAKHTIRLANGEVLRYNHLISTMPLPTLIRQIGEEAPASIRAAAARLRNVSVRCVHIGVGRENLTEKHWIYYPEDTVFHRIFVQGNASPHCNPAGGFGLTCEITYSQYKPLPCDGDELVERCIDECRKVGLIAKDDPILVTAQCDLPYAYVVYDHARAEAVKTIRKWLEERDIILAGRYSEWEYYNSDHAFLAGKRAVERIQELKDQAPTFSVALRGPERLETSPVQ